MNQASFLTSLRLIVANTWTDVPANGIYTPLELSRVNFERKAVDGDLPLAIIDWQMRPSTDWGFANRVQEGEITIWYVCDDSEDLEDTTFVRVGALRDALLTTGLTYGQVVGECVAEIGLELPPNTYFASQQRPYQAGRVTAHVVAGEQR